MGRLILDTTLGAGETAKAGGDKINSNFAQLFATITAPRSGKWFYAIAGGATAAAGQNGSGSLWLYPFVLTEETTIAEIGFRVSAGSAGVTGMLGIYAHSATTGNPTGNVLASVSGLSMVSAVQVTAALGANVTLQPGIYWGAMQASGATATAQATGSTELGLLGTVCGADSIADLAGTATTVTQYRGVTNTFGTFPDLTGVALTPTVLRNGALLYYRTA